MRGIRSNQIRNGAISGEKIASGALDTGHISNDFILGPPNYGTGSILDRHLYSGSIDGNKIRPQGIQGSRIANYAITRDKYAGSSIYPTAINPKSGLIYNDYLPDFGKQNPEYSPYLGVSTESISIAFSSDKLTFAPYNTFTESIYLGRILQLSQNSGSKKIEMSGSVEISGSVLVNGSPIGSPDLSNYITSDQTSSFIISDQTASFGIPQIINVTYSELETLISASQLVPQQKYRITNFNSYAYSEINNQCVYGMPEPLLIDAITTSSLSIIAVSERHPKDLIWYDINSSSFSDMVSPNFGGVNLSGSSVYKTGGIFRRYDPERNIDLPFDWRTKMSLVVSQSVVISLTGSFGYPYQYQAGYPSITTSSFGQFVTDPTSDKIYLSISRNNTDDPTNSYKYISPFSSDSVFFAFSDEIVSYNNTFRIYTYTTFRIAVPSIDENSYNITYDFPMVINPEGFYDEEGTQLYYPRPTPIPANFIIRNSSEIKFAGGLGAVNLNYVYKSSFRGFRHIMIYDSKNLKIESDNFASSVPWYTGRYFFNSVLNIKMIGVAYSSNSSIFLESCSNIDVESTPQLLWLKKIFNSKFITIGSVILSNNGIIGGYSNKNATMDGSYLDTMPWSTYALSSISIMGGIGHNEIFGANYSSIANDITVPWETNFYENYLYNVAQLAVSGAFYENVVKVNSPNNSAYIKFTGSFINNTIETSEFTLVHKIPSASWSATFQSNRFQQGTYNFGTIYAPWSQSTFYFENNKFENCGIGYNTHRVELYNNCFYNTSITNTSMSQIVTSNFNNIQFSYTTFPIRVAQTTFYGKVANGIYANFTSSAILPDYNTHQKNISYDGNVFFISYLNNSGSFISTRSSTIP